MRRKLLLGLFVVAVAVAALAVPLAASADRSGHVVVGVRLDFVSATHAEGTFAACCAVEDAGTAEADVLSFTPTGNFATFEAIETLTGSDGSLRLRLRGTSGPLSSARHVARGSWSILSGTGDYAGLRGQGVFTAVTDTSTGALTAINEGAVVAIP